MRNPGSHRPSGSFADFTTKAANRIKGHCERCGCGLSNAKNKKYCPPCSADSYDEKLAARRARAKERLTHVD